MYKFLVSSTMKHCAVHILNCNVHMSVQRSLRCVCTKHTLQIYAVVLYYECALTIKFTLNTINLLTTPNQHYTHTHTYIHTYTYTYIPVFYLFDFGVVMQGEPSCQVKLNGLKSSFPCLRSQTNASVCTSFISIFTSSIHTVSLRN